MKKTIFDDTYDDSDIDYINRIMFYAAIVFGIMVMLSSSLGIYL